MTENLVNPKPYVPGHVKCPDVRFAGGKYYHASLGGAGLPFLVGVEKHRRASEADTEAKQWRERLISEYDASLLALVGGDEPTSESAAVVEPVA